MAVDTSKLEEQMRVTEIYIANVQQFIAGARQMDESGLDLVPQQVVDATTAKFAALNAAIQAQLPS